MINWPLTFSILGPISLLVIGALINRYFERRPKLLVHYGHIAAFKLNDEARTDVFTHSVVLKNAGNTAANNVVIGHNILPNVVVFPAIQHEFRAVPDTGQEIYFPTLVPKETVTVSYLYKPPHTFKDINTYVRSDWGHAKVIKVDLQQIFPKWVTRLALFLMIIGLSAILYLCVVGINEVCQWCKKVEQATSHSP